MAVEAVARFAEFDVDAVTLARRLLGQRLVSCRDGARVAGIITEVEAYLGAEDQASHARNGLRSARNEAMYGDGGLLYVYLIYGMHHCANVVAGDAGAAEAVLIRAVTPTEGLAAMRLRRGPSHADTALCAGPGRLAQAFAIDRRDDGRDLRGDREIWIERTRARSLPSFSIERTPRVGVAYAGSWATKPLRFVVRS